GVVVAATASVLAVAAPRPGGSGRDPARRWAARGLLGAWVVVLAGLVAVTGGLAGPLWVLFAPVLVFAAVVAPRVSNALVGLGVVVALAVAGVLSRSVTPAEYGLLVVVAGTLLAMALIDGELADSLFGLERRASSERNTLAAQVADLSEALARTAQGDLAAEARTPDPATVNSAVLALTEAFNHTVGNLRLLVDQVRGGGEQISASAEQLLATAEDHAISATEQSSAVAQTTSTIEELAATAAQIADTAESVARFAGETLHHAEEGRQAVAASVRSMDAIAVRVETIAARSLVLGEKSQEIGRILQVIDDLADQTNLLALNAAIEAARAGDQGRGFAVVAAEIRKLAERSGQSASQIQTIVSQIQTETNATIVASEEGAKEVHRGAALSRDVVDALERISGMVDETTTAAKEISIATQQQRSASDQVVAAMTQVSDVSRQYAVGSKQTAAAASELNLLAADLRASIAQFRVA
ncbi:MAG: methyl-accepting chemotaxis protein, partial [Actinomycetes bacterium]